MDAIGKYLSPLTDLKIGFDGWDEGDDRPVFAAPLKNAVVSVEDADENTRDDIKEIIPVVTPASLSEEKVMPTLSVPETGSSDEFCRAPAADFENTVAENGTAVKNELSDVKEIVTEYRPAPELKREDVKTENAENESMPSAAGSAEKTDESPEKRSFLSTLRIVSVNNEIAESAAENTVEKVSERDDSLITAHVIAPLLKTIGSMAYRYRFTMSPEDEEYELSILVNHVKEISRTASETFRINGVSSIGIHSRFMYVSRPIVQQAYELYHSPMSDVYKARICNITQALAGFVSGMFISHGIIGEMDAHDRIDFFEALSPVIIPVGQSEDENPAGTVKEVCRVIIQKADEWCNNDNSSGVYSDRLRIISRFSALFSDVYLAEIERFLHLESDEKHIYINTYNQIPALPIIWNLFDKKTSLLKKASEKYYHDTGATE